MLEFFRDGGYAMFVTLVLGTAFVVASVREARGPDARGRRTLFGLGALTLLSGGAGFVLGVHASLSAAGRDGLPNAAMIGTAESLNNLALAFALVAAGVAISTVGAWRSARLTA